MGIRRAWNWWEALWHSGYKRVQCALILLYHIHRVIVHQHVKICIMYSYASLSNVSVGIYCMRSVLATRHLPHRNFLFILVFLFTVLSFALAPQQVYKQLFAINVIFFFLYISLFFCFFAFIVTIICPALSIS